MNTQGGKHMTALTIAGICLALIGILVLVWGMTLEPFDTQNPDFMSFATGVLLLMVIGLCMMTGLPAIVQIVGIWLVAVAIMLYIFSLPDMDWIIGLIGCVPVLGLAAWLTSKFWK